MRNKLIFTSFVTFCLLLTSATFSKTYANQVWETIVGSIENITAGGESDTGGGSSTESGFPFLCQYGSTYANGGLKSYGHWDYSGCPISSIGCNPTSTAMLMRYFGDTGRTPPNIAKSTGNVSCDATSYNEMQYTVVPWLRNRGYIVTGNLTPNQSWNVPLQTLKDYIDRGYILHAGAPVRVACSAGLCGFTGHAFLIIDVDPAKESMTAVDPTWCRSPRIGGIRTLDNVKSRSGSIQCDGPYCGWYYINAVKRR